MSAKVLYTDIETSPIVAHVWGLRDQNVGINQIVEDPYVIGVGYGWDGKPSKYVSTWDQEELGGRAFMLGFAWELLDQADVVVHYNGNTFDVPWLYGEFAREGLTPPSPFKQIDLYRVVRKNFRFPSYKLDYVAGALLGENKLSTGGHQLWVDCLNGDPRARARMARYCRQDVNLLPKLLEALRPWLPNTVNFALYEHGESGPVCGKCGYSEFLRPKGTAYTATRGYPQYVCEPARGGCGGWTRDNAASFSIKGVGSAR